MIDNYVNNNNEVVTFQDISKLKHNCGFIGHIMFGTTLLNNPNMQ